MKLTMEVRSTEGELWYLRALPLDFAQEIIKEHIAPTAGFKAGNWKIIIRPYNEATDRDPIGDLKFLHQSSGK